jgi:hypothetical protein
LENLPDLSGKDAAKVIQQMRELQDRSSNEGIGTTDLLELYRKVKVLEDCTRPDIVERWNSGPWIGPSNQWKPFWPDSR